MKIEFHYTYIIIAIGFILTGYFSNLLIFTSIILFHELGHYLMAHICNIKPQKITIYPFGGITKISAKINTPIYQELIIAMSGIIFQTIYYLFIFILYKNSLIREYIFNIFNKYHYSILFFNILPIYPLDGAKIINLILSKYIPYKLSLKLTIIISLLTTIIIIKTNYYRFNYTMIMIILLIGENIIKYYQNIDYYFNKFLLERYLYHFTFKKTRNIDKITKMYKEKYHIIKENDKYLTEKQYLRHRFKGNY